MPTQPRTTTDAPTILIIDDHRDFLEIYTKTLEGGGFRVRTAANGMDGVEIAKSERPDLIFLDIMMPGVDGIATLKLLKLNTVTASIPVVMLTNLPEESGLDRAKGLGAVDYFLKVHFEPETFIKKTQELLERYRQQNDKGT